MKVLGFVLKHSAPAELVAAIRAALDGKTYLTPAVAGEKLQKGLDSWYKPAN